MRNQRLATIALFLCGSILLHGQDPAAFLFRQHSSVFNPALAGATGSQSVSLAYRQQWLDADAAGYQTALLAYDESLPCSILDYGIGAMWDMEGEGLLTTWEISPRVSVNLPLSITTDHHINLRLGGGFSFGWQDIRLDRLIFSDQLDPKYGDILPTSFIPPDEDLSGQYIQPGIGAAVQMILNQRSPSAFVVNFGASYHNAYGFGRDENSGYGKSLLGLFAPQSPRFAAHADFEVIPGAALRQFVSIRPVFLFERQQGIHYFQYGVDFGLMDAMRIGGFLHHQRLGGASSNTNWISVMAHFRPYIGKERTDLYVVYSFNSSGLRHAVSPLIEIGFRQHFRNSPACRLIGKGDDVDYGGRPVCRYSRISPGKKKIYENVWYKD